ncbi:MAG: hypothetical protein K6T94_21625 [Paenibacillus sp.]|nr:hypothetical protein [Paenibacillus sp.]
MNLYQMKSNPYGIEQISKFLEDNFVSIGLQGIGDLENVEESQVRERLEAACGSKDQELRKQLEMVSLFVHTMQDGDYVLVVEQDFVHLGDLGDYFYDELSDTAATGLCHRRGVTWLTRIPLVEMNSEVQELLAQTEMISQFKYPLARAQLNQWSSNLLGSERVTAKSVQLDEETIAQAIEILKKALHSDDEERRERAAIAILQYVK